MVNTYLVVTKLLLRIRFLREINEASEVNFSLQSKVGVYDALEELIIPQSLKVMIPPGP